MCASNKNSKNGLTGEYHTLYLNMQSYAELCRDIQGYAGIYRKYVKVCKNADVVRYRSKSGM